MLFLLLACINSAEDSTSNRGNNADTEPVDSADSTDSHTGDPADKDGDGYPYESDCNDDDPAINRDATEVCDGVDNDCSGYVDDYVMLSWYQDRDRDGYGNADAKKEACEAPAGYVENDDDCDDTAGGNNPAASEICDGMDNNCDGNIDEAC